METLEKRVARRALREALDTKAGREPAKPNRKERREAEALKRKLLARAARRKHEGRCPRG